MIRKAIRGAVVAALQKGGGRVGAKYCFFIGSSVAIPK